MSENQSKEEVTNLKDQPLTSVAEDQSNNISSQDFSSQNSNEAKSKSKDQPSVSVPKEQTNNMVSQGFSSQQSNEETSKFKDKLMTSEPEDQTNYLGSQEFLILSNSLRSLGQVEETNKRFPPGMKRMLQVQSRNTLLEIHKELKEFIKFVEDVQKETPTEWEVIKVKPLKTNKTSSPASSSNSSSNSEFKELRSIDPRPTNAPIRDAFQIVRNLLSKMATLVDKTAFTAAITDDASVDVCSPEFNIYYAQYVFQIACYVSKMIGEHLNKFSCILDETSKRETELSDKDFQSSSMHPNLFLHRKDHSYCSRNNDRPDSSNRGTSKDVSGSATIYSKNTTHVQEKEISKRISDAIELLQLLSERMLSSIEGESEFTDAIENQTLKENVKYANSFGINRKGEHFPDNNFSILLKDEMKKNLYEYSNKFPENSGCSNTIAILNLIGESFQKARGVKVTECKDDNSQKSDTSHTKQDEEKHLADAIEAFVNETYKFTLFSSSTETENETPHVDSITTTINLRKAQTEPEPITIEEKVVLPAKPKSSSEIQNRTGIEEIRECSSCPRLVKFKLSDYIQIKPKNLFLVTDSEDIRSSIRLSPFGQRIQKLLGPFFLKYLIITTDQEKTEKDKLFISTVIFVDTDTHLTRYACNEQCLKGPILHENHDLLPMSKMEVRKVNDRGHVVISLEDCDKPAISKELINCTALLDLRKRPSLKDMVPERNSNIIKDLLPKLRSPRKVDEQLMTTTSYSDLTPIVKIGGTTHDKAIDICEIVEKMHNLGQSLRNAGYNTGPPLILKLRLENVHEEAFKTLTVPSGIPLSYYKKILILVYKKSEESEVEDLTDEMFPILGENLLHHQDEGPFVYPSDRSMSVYPNPASLFLSEYFRFTGILLAIAIIQNEFLRVKLPLCFYKCLLDRSLELHDLKEIDPVLHQKLKWLNENNISGRKPMFYFTIKEKVGKEMIVSELIENGKLVPVLENNKILFIEKCLKRKIVEGYITQFQEIINGFNSVLEPRFLDEFKVDEIQRMMEKCPCLFDCEKHEDDDLELTIKKSV